MLMVSGVPLNFIKQFYKQSLTTVKIEEPVIQVLSFLFKYIYFSSYMTWLTFTIRMLCNPKTSSYQLD